MDLSQVRELLKIVAESDVAEVEIEQEGVKVVVRRSQPTVTVQQASAMPPFGMGYYPPPYPQTPGYAPPPPAPAAQPASPALAVPAPAAPAESAAALASADGQTVKAPIVGTFYRASSPDASPFVNVGDRVNPGDVLCIIEAMKLMNEIECEVSGVVRQVLVENAQPVEYDQPLFLIEKA